MLMRPRSRWRRVGRIFCLWLALFLGAAFLGESVTAQALAGMAIVALGLAAIDGRLLRLRGLRRPSIRHLWR